ncbi:hypothetical protein [Pseudoduganella sp. OTU4001]|uniref:hypothetical protein n=1 Tax=Pseudoduganella sp. OTU4001 TaxID=3043854 RepID=UPI00313C7CE3
MRETMKTADGRTIILSTPEEDREIMEAALRDPDLPPMTEEEWEEVRLRLIRGGKANTPAK